MNLTPRGEEGDNLDQKIMELGSFSKISKRGYPMQLLKLQNFLQKPQNS